jgi:apolipoprotein N-acyltransferase
MAFTRTPTGLRSAGVYDKHRLVPFGEFLPLEPVLEALGVKELTHVGDGFSSGPRPRPMTVPGLPPFQPLICYEGLFPGLPDGSTRAAWIVNVSNDAWFGRTSGPLQHLNLSSYRAIEQGLPLIRATPTGVSAIVDAYGRVDGEHRLDPGESGVIDALLPAALENTYFSQLGDLGVWALIAVGLLVAAPVRRLVRQARR